MIPPTTHDTLDFSSFTSEHLITAAKEGDNAFITLLLSNGVAVDSYDSSDSSALMVAISHGQEKTAELLLQYGASLSHLDASGTTALALALVYGMPELAQKMLQKRPYRLEIELRSAAQSGSLPAISFLISCGADLNAPDSDGYTALDWAIARDQEHCADLLLEYAPMMNQSTLNNALFNAFCKGHHALFDKILQHGGLPIQYRNDSNPISLLFFSKLQQQDSEAIADVGQADLWRPFIAMIVRWLKKQSVAIWKEQLLGMLCFLAHHDDIASFFLANCYESSLEQQDVVATIIENSLCRDDYEARSLLRFFLIKEPDIVKSIEMSRRSLLEYAFRHGAPVAHISLLMESLGIGLEYAAKVGLGVSIEHGRKEHVAFLLDQGLKPETTVIIRKKISPVSSATLEVVAPALILAAEYGQVEIIALLLSHGADLNAVSSDGLTALSCSVLKGFRQIIELLLSTGACPNFYTRTIQHRPTEVYSDYDFLVTNFLLKQGPTYRVTGASKKRCFFLTSLVEFICDKKDPLAPKTLKIAYALCAHLLRQIDSDIWYHLFKDILIRKRPDMLYLFIRGLRYVPGLSDIEPLTEKERHGVISILKILLRNDAVASSLIKFTRKNKMYYFARIVFESVDSVDKFCGVSRPDAKQPRAKTPLPRVSKPSQKEILFCKPQAMRTVHSIRDFSFLEKRPLQHELVLSELAQRKNILLLSPAANSFSGACDPTLVGDSVRQIAP